jgi:succinate dehydrogenase/fumarate reductase flavoprotein subunit
MGANRLSGNAVTECVVFGGLAGISAAQYAKNAPPPEIDDDQVDRYYERAYKPLNRKDGPDTVRVREKIQEMAFKYAGPIREESGLTRCLEEIEKMKKDVVPNVFSKAKERVYNREWMEALEIESMVRMLEIVVCASLMRKESRGAMYRRDFPDTDNKGWLSNVIVSNKDGHVSLEARPVVTSRVELPKREKTPYMVPTWKFSRKA